MDETERDIFTELERRKNARDPEESCDSCNGSGAIGPSRACLGCLGQGVLLTQEEYDLILKLSGVTDDGILDAKILDG